MPRLLLSVYWVCLFLFISRCGREKLQSNGATPPIDSSVLAEEKTWLALGDSYTVGQGVPPEDRYPVQTTRWLRANGLPKMDDAQIIASTGWTTLNLLAALQTQDPERKFDIVSVLSGVNDQHQSHDTTGYRDRFLQILNKSIAFANHLPTHVVVISIPDYTVTPFGRNLDSAFTSHQIDQYNSINREVSLAKGVQYLDISASFREASNNPSLVCGDGLHPSAIEYRKWAERLGPLIKSVLK
jgi:lysophospholipase L1-like esterase